MESVSAPLTVPLTPIALHGKPALPPLENAQETAALPPLTALTAVPTAMPRAHLIRNALPAIPQLTLAHPVNSAPPAHQTNHLMNLDLVMPLNALTTTPIAHLLPKLAQPSVLALPFHALQVEMSPLSALRP